MDNDLLLVIGIVISCFSIPSLVSAFTDGRAPRIGGIMVVVGLALIAVALSRQPNGYSFSDIPAAFYRVIGRLN
ncbi:MAG: hypothetical protein QM656_15790 [Paracoccaceae bacterium]